MQFHTPSHSIPPLDSLLFCKNRVFTSYTYKKSKVGSYLPNDPLLGELCLK